MRVLAPALLVLLSLLAGCLEEAPPAEPSPGAGLLRPTPTPIPSPEPPSRLLYERTHAFVAPRVDDVSVPEDTVALHVRVVLGPAAVVEAAALVSVALDAPNGTRMAECIDGTCVARIGSPANGTWRVVYEGVAPREATVTLRVEPTPPRLPPTLPPTVVPTAPTPATPPASPPLPSPIPTPTPAPGTPRIPGTEWKAYSRTYDYGAFRSATFENDTFAVPGGLDALVFKVRFDGTGDAEVRLVDPQGARKGLCRADGAPCQVEVSAPAAGRWQVEYDGDRVSLRADVGAHGSSTRPIELPSALPAFRQVHTYPQHDGNRTSSFWVTDGYGWVNLTFFFSRTLPPAPGDSPFVQVHGPDRSVVLACRMDLGYTCDLAAEAKPGLWTVWYLAPGTGAVRVDALLTERAPRAHAPSDPAPGPGERTLHRDLRHGADAVPFTVGSDVARLRILVEANRTMAGTVGIEGPGGVGVVTCSAPCHVAVSAPWPGGWAIRYSPQVGGDVGTTVNAWSRP